MKITVIITEQAAATKAFFDSVEHSLTDEAIEDITRVNAVILKDATEGKAYDVTETIEIKVEGGEPFVGYRILDDVEDVLTIPEFLAILA